MATAALEAPEARTTNRTRKFICECDDRACRLEFEMTEAKYDRLSAEGHLNATRCFANRRTIIERGDGWKLVQARA